MVLRDRDGNILENTGPLFSELSKQIPARKFDEFCNALGVSYNPARTTLTQHGQDFMTSVRVFLGDWENSEGASKEGLRDALRMSELGGLRYIVDKHFPASPSSLGPGGDTNRTEQVREVAAAVGVQPAPMQQRPDNASGFSAPSGANTSGRVVQPLQAVAPEPEINRRSDTNGIDESIPAPQQQAAAPLQVAKDKEKHVLEYEDEQEIERDGEKIRSKRRIHIDGKQWILPATAVAVGIMVCFLWYKGRINKSAS